MFRPPPEALTKASPVQTGVHTLEECDHMLALDLKPVARDAWLDERLRAMQALAFDRPNAPEDQKVGATA